MSDYTSGQHRLPVQWIAWLSHTRAAPPTLGELQSDAARQSTLLPKIAEIELREREERYRQGYIPSPDAPAAIHSGLSFGSIGSGSRIRSAPSFAPPSSAPPRHEPGSIAPLRVPAGSAFSDPDDAAYPVPTPASPGVPAPPQTVDPAVHASHAGLRKLAEEDTKRRIEENGATVSTSDKDVQGVGVGLAGLKPRRRGGS